LPVYVGEITFFLLNGWLIGPAHYSTVLSTQRILI